MYSPASGAAPPSLVETTFTKDFQYVDIASSAQNQTIGIDVAHILRDIAYQPLVEVLPAEFTHKVTQIVDYITLEAKKKVILMFDGLLEEQAHPIMIRGVARSADDTVPQKLKLALGDSIFPLPLTADTLNALFIWLVRNYAGNKSVLIMRAPYFAWSQLAVLHFQGQINEIVGPIELLLFPNVKRVLVAWIGGEFSSLDAATISNYYGRNVHEAISYSSTHRYIKAFRSRGFGAPFLVFSPVYTMNGTSIQMTRIDNVIQGLPFRDTRVPASELNGFFGKNIWNTSKELMLQMSYGVLPVAVVRAIVHDYGSGNIPLNISTSFCSDQTLAQQAERGVVYPAFLTCLNYMHPLLVQIVYQVIDKFKPYSSNNNTCRPPEIKLDEWDLNGWLPEHLPHWLSYLHLLGLRARPVAEYPDSVAVHLSVRLKVLDLMGYFTHAMTNDTSDDSGLSSFAHALKTCRSSHACAGVLFIESCRTLMLHGKSLLVSPSGDLDVLPSSHELPMLGARIMSLIKLRRNKDELLRQPWNMNVIAFSNLARLSFSVLQQLNLVMAFNTFRGNNFTDISSAAIYDNLIFNEAPSPHMGFVAWKIFSSKDTVTLAELQKSFPEATNLVEDLRDAADFFKSVYLMVEEMREDDSNLNDAQTDEIKTAYDFCAEKLRRIPELEQQGQWPCPDMRNGYGDN